MLTRFYVGTNSNLTLKLCPFIVKVNLFQLIVVSSEIRHYPINCPLLSAEIVAQKIEEHFSQ